MKILLTIALIAFSTSAFSQKPWKKFDKAVKHQRKERFEKAIKIYTSLLNIEGMEYGCWMNRGQCYYGMGEFQLALSDLYKAFILVPKDSGLVYLIGASHMGNRDWLLAAQNFKRAGWLGHKIGAVELSNIGSCYYFANELDSAKKYLHQSIELDSLDQTPFTNLGFSYLDDNPENSCIYFKKAYQIDNSDPTLVNNLGYSYYLCGNLEVAFSYYEKSKKMDPTNSYVYRNIGLYYIAMDDRENACLNYQMALDKDFIASWGKSHIIELINYCEKK